MCFSSQTKVAPPSEELIGAAGAGGLSYLHQQKKQREETKRRHAEMSMSEPDQMPAYQGSKIFEDGKNSCIDFQYAENRSE